MTIAELIFALSAYPSDTLVVVRGYEAGYNDASIQEKEIVLNDNPKDSEGYIWYYGTHGSDRHNEDSPKTKVIVL